MAATIKGDTSVLWGAGALYATGVISGGSIVTSSEEVLVPNNDGEDIASVLFNVRKEATINIIVQTAAPTLAIGDAITVKGEEGFLVKRCEETFANKDVRKYSVNAVKHASLVLGS